MLSSGQAAPFGVLQDYSITQVIKNAGLITWSRYANHSVCRSSSPKPGLSADASGLGIFRPRIQGVVSFHLKTCKRLNVVVGGAQAEWCFPNT